LQIWLLKSSSYVWFHFNCTWSSLYGADQNFSSLSFHRISIKQETPVRSSLHTIWSIFYFSPAYVTGCSCNRTTHNEEPPAEASRGSSLTTTLLASPRYASSSSPLQDLFCYSTYGLIWFHLCLFIFRKIYKPLDLLVFQLLVKVGSFVTWPGFLYVWEDCDCGWIFEIVGTRGGRSVSYCWRDCLSQNAKDMRHFASMQKIPEAPLLCR
jgi:hypothetical protein